MQVPKVSYRWLSWLRILIVIGVLAHAAISIHQLERQTIEVAGESLSRIAADIADKLDLLLFERYGDMRAMSKSGILHGRDADAINDYLDLFHQAYPIYGWLAVTDAQGRITAATDREDIGSNQSGKPWFHAVRETGDIHIQDAEASPEAGGEWAVAFSAPILDSEGKFLGAVTARIGLSVLRTIFDRTVIPVQMSGNPDARVEWLLLDRNGELITDSWLGAEGRVNLRTLGVPSASFSRSAGPGYVEEQHQRRQVEIVRGFAHTKGVGEFPGLEWTVLVSMDRADIVAPLYQIVRNLGLAGSLIFFPLVALLIWFSRRLRQEWEQTQAEGARASKAEQQYRAARNQLADVLDHAPDPIFFTDTTGHINRWSRGAQRVLGYEPEAVVTKNVVDLFLDPKRWEPILHELKEKGEVIGREVELRNPEGYPVHISLTLTNLRNPEGERVGTVALCKDVTVAKRTEESLRMSNEELENFVYAISHDLQAPLRGIQGFAVLLFKRAGERLNEQERHYLGRIQKGAERMEGLIQDLLEYSRIERVIHPKELLNMEKIIDQVRLEIEDRVQLSVFDCRIEGVLPSIYGDRIRLSQLWANLLSNAIKYVKPGELPVIRIGCRENGQQVVFFIRDNGIGIAPEFHARIFGIFNRLHNNEQFEGTGIGLAIVKRIVEFHQGKIWVESAEGEGSTFFFTLPKTQGGIDHHRSPDVLQSSS